MSRPEEQVKLAAAEKNDQARGLAPDANENPPVEARMGPSAASPSKTVHDGTGKTKARHTQKDRRRKMGDGKSTQKDLGASHRSLGIDKGGSKHAGEQVKKATTKRTSIPKSVIKGSKTGGRSPASPTSVDSSGHRTDEVPPSAQPGNPDHGNAASVGATTTRPWPRGEISRVSFADKDTSKKSVEGRGTKADDPDSPSSKPTRPAKLPPPGVPLKPSGASEGTPKRPPESTPPGTAGKTAAPTGGNEETPKTPSETSGSSLSAETQPSASVTDIILSRQPYRECAVTVPEGRLDASSEKSRTWHGRIIDMIRTDSVKQRARNRIGPVPSPRAVKSRYSGSADYQSKTR